ncbi:hypothetical protein U9M48_020352 [Paspalum notatum var. saurae]|uniref:Uncharacterized protein n=1 Tax=Paspalum notatum var. saurae TaxID=547442 RepID=A0AAQ3WRY3_PASNO
MATTSMVSIMVQRRALRLVRIWYLCPSVRAVPSAPSAHHPRRRWPRTPLARRQSPSRRQDEKEPVGVTARRWPRQRAPPGRGAAAARRPAVGLRMLGCSPLAHHLMFLGNDSRKQRHMNEHEPYLATATTESASENAAAAALAHVTGARKPTTPAHNASTVIPIEDLAHRASGCGLAVAGVCHTIRPSAPSLHHPRDGRCGLAVRCEDGRLGRSGQRREARGEEEDTGGAGRGRIGTRSRPSGRGRTGDGGSGARGRRADVQLSKGAHTWAPAWAIVASTSSSGLNESGFGCF